MSQRVVLCLQRTDDGPVCKVKDVSRIEVFCLDGDAGFVIEHHDRRIDFHIDGVGLHEVVIPAGRVRVRRKRGSHPATVYAWS